MTIRVRHAFAAAPVLVLLAASALPADTPAKPTHQAAAVIRLHARDAEIQGTGAAYESRPDRGCVGLWESSDVVARWRFELKVPGEYFVDVCQSWDRKKDVPASWHGKDPAGELTVKVADQSCTAKVLDTGDWGRFRIIRAGKVKLARRGLHPAVVTGRLGGGRHVMNLRGVRLVPVVAAPGNPICLEADHAEIQGTGAVYEPRAERDCVGQWKHADVVVRWRFEVRAPGEYFVDVSQSCDGTMAGGEIALKVADQSLAAKVLDTRDWAEFRTVRAGKVKFARPGVYSVVVTGRPKPDMFLMNLRGVRLVPTGKPVAARPTPKPVAPPPTPKPAEPFDARKFAALVEHTLDGAKTDAERATRLYDAAQVAEGRRTLQVRLLAEAVKYALRSPAAASARDAATRALHLLDQRAPDRKRQWLLKRVQLYRGWYRNTTKREEKPPAGAKLVDLLLELAGAFGKEGKWAEAADLCREAKLIASHLDLPSKAEISQTYLHANSLAGARRKVGGYIRILNKEPQNARIRAALIHTLLVDLDEPAEARGYLTDDVDQELRTYLPLAARPVSELPVATARQVGDWYLKKLAAKASPHAAPAMLARAKACYQRVVELVPGDLPAKITLGQITKRLEKLGFRPATVARRPPGTQGQPPPGTRAKVPPAGTSTSLAELPKVLAPLRVNVLLSTGHSRAGTVFRCDKDRLFLRLNGQFKSCHKANIVDLALHLPEPDQQKLARLRAAWQDLAVGRILLDHKFPGLAEVEFAQAVRKERSIAGEVRQAYSDAEVPLPESLGGQPSSDPEKRGKARRYPLPTPAQIHFATRRADELAAKMRKIAAATHLIETDHYRVFSAWSQGEDAKLKEIYQKLYGALCEQFMIPPWEHIFIGKLPVYAFWRKDNYVRFCVEVLRIPMETAMRSGGFMSHAGLGDYRERFLVLGPAYLAKGMPKSQARTWFYELLVHESTHAFTGRFINENPIANWVDEGISEIMACTLVPGCGASRKWKAATRQARREGTPVTGIFRGGNIPADGFHYGIAQSMVRFLYDRDRRKFIQFVKLMKQGKSDQEALQEAYGLTQRRLIAAWERAIR